MTRITNVNPKDNYRLEISLENGTCLTLDLKPMLHTIRFGILRDESIFQRAETNGVVIRWGNKLEISAGELFELAQR